MEYEIQKSITVNIAYKAKAEIDVPMGFDKTAEKDFSVSMLRDLNAHSNTAQAANGQGKKTVGGFLCIGGGEAEGKVKNLALFLFLLECFSLFYLYTF